MDGPDGLLSPLGVEAPALAWLVAVAVAAGLVRGFSGFGTALIYVPLAGLALPPLWVLVTLTVMDLVGPLPNVPRAWREGRPRQVAWLGAAALAGLLPGLWLLDRMSDEAFRWVVSTLCLATVAAMAAGWRLARAPGAGALGATGAASGLLGGVSGLAGPPVILLHLAAPWPAAVVRANVLLYLVLWDALFGAVLWGTGRLEAAPVALGAVLIAPYLLANVAGARLFAPGRERLYRRVAFGLIAAAAVLAVPWP